MDFRLALQTFKDNYYDEFQTEYLALKDQQNPDTLFITCSDSRILPDQLLNTKPGEVFMVRNIANVVPPFGQSVDYASTTSTIEYAVKVLGVKDIVVCGHSNCGGCRALSLSDEELADIPYTKKWIELVQEARDKVENELPHASELEKTFLTEQFNVQIQSERLMDYPFIAEKVAAGDLTIHAWYYNISEGKMSEFSKKDHRFNEIN